MWFKIIQELFWMCYLSADDDAEAWFQATERLLVSHNESPARRALAVIPYLKGEARSAYTNLPANLSLDFSEIKAVLSGFCLDDEEYRRHFRSTNRSGSGETYSELCYRLGDSFSKWMFHCVPASNSPDLGSVTDEIIREQLISSPPAPVQQHVKEQSKVDAAGTAKLADALCALNQHRLPNFYLFRRWTNIPGA